MGSLVLRMTFTGLEFWSWTTLDQPAKLSNETLIWVLLRWVVGFLGPIVLSWMAWQSAKIRSTQSATGILYVVVIFSFLGELTSQLLLTRPAGSF